MLPALLLGHRRRGAAGLLFWLPQLQREPQLLLPGGGGDRELRLPGLVADPAVRLDDNQEHEVRMMGGEPRGYQHAVLPALLEVLEILWAVTNGFE